MAKKRKSSELLDQSQPSSRPKRQPAGSGLSKELDEDYRILMEKASIKEYFMTTTQGSKENIKNETLECYRFLWWKEKSMLRDIEHNFLKMLAANQISKHNDFAKFTHLLQELKACATACSPARQKGSNRTQSPPRSPSLATSRSLTNYLTVSKPIQNAPVFSKPTLHSHSIERTCTTFADTSFDSDVIKSFNNESFWSSGEPPTGSQSTDITVPSQVPARAMSRRSSEFSSSTSSVHKDGRAVKEALEAPQDSINTERTAEPPQLSTRAFPNSCKASGHARESQYSNYGSSLDPGDVEMLNASINNPTINQAYSPNRYPRFNRQISIETPDLDKACSEDSERHLRRVPNAEPLLSTIVIDGGSELAYPGASQDDHIRDTKLRRHGGINHTSNCQTGPSVAEDFFGLKVPPSLQGSDFETQCAIQIALQTGKVTADDLGQNLNCTNLEAFRRFLAKKDINISGLCRPENLKEYEVMTRNAKFQWAKKRGGPVLDLVVLPARRETACSLQRYLGADRVLYVDLPDLSRPPLLFKGRDVQKAFRQWLKRSHTFLGREWRLFFLQPNKKKSVNSERSTGIAANDVSTAALHRLILVSPRPNETIRDIVNWCLPIKPNSHQSARKAYMRLELKLSRTIVAAVLKPEDVELVPDQLATNDADDRQFEDPKLSHDFHEHIDDDNPTVMNDGCNVMDGWLAHRYMKAVGLRHKPPCLQIRVAGAKGLWYIENDSSRLTEERPRNGLIKISPSQIKVVLASLAGCDDETMAVSVVKGNPLPKASILHNLFLPILLSRGVSKDAICDLVGTQTQEEATEFLQALEASDSLQLRQWMTRQKDFQESRMREQGIETLAGFPRATEERVTKMLESGFDPKQCRFLAKEVTAMAKNHFELEKKNFKIRLAKSSTLWGIADPLGILEPGEIHICFDSAFVNSSTGESWMFLDNTEGLICRNPALAPWDIQKVRFRFVPQLAIYKNILVFSSKGMRPLASKLQGGDYDGDQFWFTWEPKLVKDFQNAPAPWAPPPPGEFGIIKDKSLLSDHIKENGAEDQYAVWLANMAIKRMDANMLGTVTLYLERLNYAQGTIDTKASRMLTHLHDYLVDSDKQGYDFDQAAFDRWRKRWNLPGNLPTPYYWKFTRGDMDGDKAKEKTFYLTNVPDVKENIIDWVYAEIVEPIVQTTLRRVRDVLEPAGMYDSDLSKFYNETIDGESKGSEIRQELLGLKDEMDRVREIWLTSGHQSSFSEQVEKTRASYDGIQPKNLQNQKIQGWLCRQGHDYSTWDKLKASCFAKTQYRSNERPGLLIFSVAGNEMCDLKINELGVEKRAMVLPYYNALKMRKIKRLHNSDDFDDDGSHEQEAAIEQAGYY